MMRIHNYFTKLFLLVMITVVISSCVISGISIVRYVKNIQSATEQRLMSSAEQKALIYEVNIKSLHMLSKSICNDKQIESYFKELKAGRDDKSVYQNIKSDLEAEMNTYPGLLENAFFVYNGICYIDGLGGTSVGYDFVKENSEWYERTIDSKEQILGKIKQSPITGLPVMVSACPVLDENNELLAVFGLAINLDGFSNTIIANTVSSKENTFITDNDGTVVAANDTGLIFNYHISTELPNLYQYTKEHKEGITYYKKDGKNYIAAIKKSSFGVMIIQALPVNVYQDPIIAAIFLSIAVLLTILILVTVIIYFIAKNITKPIHILVDEFHDMGLGVYDNEIPDYLKKRKDEFGKLGNSLADMKNQTNQLITKLNLAYEETEASLEEVIATEEELRKHNDLLSESENELQKSSEYNKAILNVIPDVIYIINREGVITDCQDSLELLPYLPKELFLNKNIKDLLNQEVTEEVYQVIQTALDTGTLQIYEHEFILDNKCEIFEFRVIRCFDDAVIAIARNITEQRLHQKQIEYLSYHDQLTGLNNRRFFEDELKRLDIEDNLPLCIIMADVNGLKLINDSFGHKAGDMLLIKVAKVLKEAYPSDNLISRIGGDEFVIIAPKMNSEKADELVKNIKNRCDKEEVMAVSLSVSFGWDVKKHIDEDINAILKSAEDYMYKRKLFDGPNMKGKTIGIIINTLHEKNSREEQHSHRVADLCEKIAVVLKMPEQQRKEIRSAGLLHDIGKIAIQESLLNKPDKLTKEEFEEIIRHPEIGYRILYSANEMTDIAEYILSHHERWDGKGYPRRIKGENIPLQARMIAIADAFDAMTSIRSYRKPVSEEEAARELWVNAGKQFDPKLTRIFVEDILGYHFDMELNE